MLDEPLDFAVAKALVRSIMRSGEFRITTHAFAEMEADSMEEIDVVNVLRGGVVEGCDHERGSWRYRVRTPRFTVVVSFRSESAMVIVTAWRN